MKAIKNFNVFKKSLLSATNGNMVESFDSSNQFGGCEYQSYRVYVDDVHYYNMFVIYNFATNTYDVSLETSVCAVSTMSRVCKTQKALIESVVAWISRNYLSTKKIDSDSEEYTDRCTESEKHYADYTSEETVKDVMEVKQDLNTRFGKKVQQYFDTDCVELNNTIIAKIENINHCPNQNTCCSEESIKDTIMTDDCIKTVLNMEELFSQMFGNTISSKCKMYNNSCYGCPADRQGNRCGGEQWCKQTWKRYGAIVNPNWHHVSLATLANIDNDMLDEKRRHYMKVYRMTANVINSIYKCNKLTSIDKLRTNLIQTVRTMAKNEKIEWALVQYVKAKIDNCYLVNGLQSSFYSTTYGNNKSRSYTKTFFI